MNTFLTLFSLLVAIMLLVSYVASRPRGRQFTSLANVAEGRYPGNKTFRTDAALATRHLLVKAGSDAAHVAVNNSRSLERSVWPRDTGR